MARLFGTDGVRGVANSELTCELAFRLGQAGALVLTTPEHRPKIYIARDTRVSGNMLFHALAAGIASVGARAVDVGVLPTLAIASLVRRHSAEAGVVVSASHNSFEFNGIKWFSGDGFKLPDEVEDRMERIVMAGVGTPLPTGGEVGDSAAFPGGEEEYISSLVSLCDADVSGMRVVLDCANGAAYRVAPEVFRRLGAEVSAHFISPDGRNINEGCGSTHPEALCELVRREKADIGLAFDGDADRLIAVDERGEVVNGDRIMALCARDLKARDQLNKNTLVVTVMSNLGMINTLKAEGISILTTDVGDRYVLERMRAEGCNFGGEQSGHMIFLDKNTTGDGVQSAVELLCAVKRQGRPVSELAGSVAIYPQILVNVRVQNDRKFEYLHNRRIAERIAAAEELFGERGRVLVRTSGTEPLVRVMIEGERMDEVRLETNEIAALIARELDGTIL